ncbi:hypothetical protein BAC1_02326 [uncultured bacterium]|nr:hypothetical protein BAC1_02326 [uncultured bacterium]
MPRGSAAKTTAEWTLIIIMKPVRLWGKTALIWPMEVGSPVSGYVMEKLYNWGLVVIKDAQGFTHEIFHLDEIKVDKGDHVTAGQIIDTMGGRGPNGVNDYAQHVHYTIRAPLSAPVNRKENNEKPAPVDPEMFWSSFGNLSVLNIPAARLELSDPSIQQRALNEKPGIIRPAKTAALSVGSRFPMVRALSGETLRRDDGDYRIVHRIEPDGSRRGYFISP